VGRRGVDATLTVTDRGGWAPAADDFSAFFQEDMSSTRPHGGFGLGLFLASRLCQACDGGLSIRAIDGATVAEARFRTR
jgi:signal transduction histidine kinase